ncbi:UNVERIFIED_CONTAM: hypothetical protein FKN15_013378 [Acipenser sinensis]
MSRYLSLIRVGFGAPRRADLRHLLSPGWGPGSRRIAAAFSSASYSAGVNQSIGVSLTGAWRPELSRCSAFVARQAYSTQIAETKEEEPLHTIIRDTENIEGSFTKHEFQAETKKLLDIVARSLYSEKEVFIRELVSNGCDALEKLRHRLLSAGGESEPMEIHLQTDAEKGTFTIQDTGIGMSKEDLVSNLGTIARSGSKTLENPQPAKFFEDYGLFIREGVVTTAEQDVKAYDKPRYTLHYRTDAPLNIRSIFYVPEMKPSMFDVSREMGSSVALYSRKVLIQTKATDILPKWLRFLRGVVDSEDIPLNLSRELLQESALIRKLSDVLQKRIIKFLVDQSRKEPEKYAKFFEDYGLFIREGVVTTAEQDVKEDIGKLLRFESSALPAGQTTSLQEYSSRMKAGTRNIHYLCAPNRHLAEHSPYYEAMRKKDMEVLFCFEQFDELTLLHLREFDKKKLISVETDIVVDHYKEEKYEDSKPESERLSQQQAEDLMAWMRNVLGSRVTNIKVTPRLDTHPAMITVLEMGAARHFLRTQQLAKTSEERAQILQPTLEINAGHDLIKKLNELKDSDMELAQLLLDQIYDNAMIAAGLNDDPRPMVGRLNELLTKALQKH